MGGPAWELKIGTERLQDKENSALEEGSEKRSGQSTYILPKKVSKKGSQVKKFLEKVDLKIYIDGRR